MQDVRFFDRAGPFSLTEIAEWVDAEVPAGRASAAISDVAPLDMAGPNDLSFFDNPRYEADLAATGAGACLVAARAASRVPETAVPLIVAAPSTAFAELLRRFYPAALAPAGVWGAEVPPDESPAVHPTARLEAGVVVEPGAVVGAEARIGAGTRILAGTVIGRRVHIGRSATIGPGATVIHAIIGDRVIVHPGVRIGQDGFGYVMGRGGHAKVPQIGRVVIQDDVEIGANTTIDRGALRDTVIGEGTKIDNLVQIGHNVVVGRHCVIVGQVGIAGSATLGDYVAIGGQAGVMTHVRIGDGAQVAALSAVRDDLAAGGQYGGVPARPAREWLKEVAALQRLARGELKRARKGSDENRREPHDD